MQPLSVTIITRNEERNIGRCLDALEGVADEIVVVDSYSTDRTAEICRRRGCRVTCREFRGFGPQRQFATGLTTHSYVLSLDADEVLDEKLRNHIVRLKTEGFDHRVYSVKVRNYFCGRPIEHSGFEASGEVRLFNKRYANWNMLHESDAVSCPEGVEPCQLDGTIHHYRCTTVDEFNRKENRIAALRAGMLAEGGRAISTLTPAVRAAAEYFHVLVGHSAWLDGRHGLTIARRRAKTVYEAWRMARHLIRNK